MFIPSRRILFPMVVVKGKRIRVGKEGMKGVNEKERNLEPGKRT